MTSKVRAAEQVEFFVRSLAPEPRRRLRQALKGLAEGRGDVKPLEGQMTGYSRLSLAGYRVIFHERFERGTRIVYCILAERRGVVYEIFTQILADEAMQ